MKVKPFKKAQDLGVIQNMLDKKGGFEISQDELSGKIEEFKKKGGEIKKLKTTYQTYEAWEFNTGVAYSRAGYTPRSGSE
jgi:hypothetical protein